MIYSLRWPRDVVEYIVWEVDQGVYRGYIPYGGGVESDGSAHRGEEATVTASNVAVQ